MDEAEANSLWTKLEQWINALKSDLLEKKVKVDLEDGGKGELDLAQVMSNVRNLIRGFVDLGRVLRDSLHGSHLKEKENSDLKREVASLSEQLKQISSTRVCTPALKPAGAVSEANSRNGERVHSSAAPSPTGNSLEERRSKKRRLARDVKEAEENSSTASPRATESPTMFPDTRANKATMQIQANVARLQPTGETGFNEQKDCSGIPFIPRRKRSVRSLVIMSTIGDGQRKRIAELEEKLTYRLVQVECLKSLVKRTHLNWQQHTIDMRRQWRNMKILVWKYQRILGEEMANTNRKTLNTCHQNCMEQDIKPTIGRPRIRFSTLEIKKMYDYIMDATDAFIVNHLEAFLEENPPGGFERYELERKTLKLERDIIRMQRDHRVATDRADTLHGELLVEQSRVKTLYDELQAEQNKVKRIETVWRSFSNFGFK